MVPVFLFSTIPFPSLSESPLKQRIRDLGEKLDDLDEAVLEAYGWSDLATTPPYQWHDRPGHEPQRADDPDDSQLTPENSSTHHDPDGRATGRPLADQLAKKDETAEAIEQELLKRLVALNHERAKEKSGLIRWLRPKSQAPDALEVP